MAAADQAAGARARPSARAGRAEPTQKSLDLPSRGRWQAAQLGGRKRRWRTKALPGPFHPAMTRANGCYRPSCALAETHGQECRPALYPEVISRAPP